MLIFSTPILNSSMKYGPVELSSVGGIAVPFVIYVVFLCVVEVQPGNERLFIASTDKEME